MDWDCYNFKKVLLTERAIAVEQIDAHTLGKENTIGWPDNVLKVIMQLYRFTNGQLMAIPSKGDILTLSY